MAFPNKFVLSGFVVLLVAAAALVIDRSQNQSDVAQEPPRQLPFSPTSTELGLAGNLWLDTSDKELVERVYDTEFSKVVPPVEWTGDQDECDAGSSSADLKAASIDRVNFYRAMAGVPATISEGPSFSAKAQSGALMMSTEGELTHQPSSSFACYTIEGSDAAANSNLYLGRTGPSAIDGYIEDPGDDNTDVGHRNTVLHPPTRRMGVADVEAVGDYDESNLLWVFDEKVFDLDYRTREPEGFVAWPPAGFVPQDIVHPRWSFSLATGDFSQADITMTQSGESVPLEIVSREGKEGRVPNPILVWEPQLDLDNDDVTFEIEVTDVRVDGDSQDFAYTTTVFA